MYLDNNYNYLNDDCTYLMDERSSKNEHCGNHPFVDPLTGIIRGNLSRDEFLTYKKYIPTMPNLKSDRAVMLFELQKYDFALHEIKLYLDLCPKHKEALSLFKKYQSEKDQLVKDYVDKYGPLKPCENIYFSNWIWVNEPWPWEGNK